MLTLTEKDLQELDKFIQEMPVKFGMPLINFINTKLKEQTKEEEQVLAEE